MKIKTPKKKYRFMIGTTSRVPGSRGWHYLVFDIDEKEISDHLLQFLHSYKCKMQKTKSGWHIYTNKRMRLRKMLRVSVEFGSDRTWAKLAIARGWAFLADKPPGIKIPWPVERKIIGWRKNAKKL